MKPLKVVKGTIFAKKNPFRDSGLCWLIQSVSPGAQLVTSSERDSTYIVMDDPLCNLDAVVGVPQAGFGLIFPTLYFIDTV